MIATSCADVSGGHARDASGTASDVADDPVTAAPIVAATRTMAMASNVNQPGSIPIVITGPGADVLRSHGTARPGTDPIAIVEDVTAAGTMSMIAQNDDARSIVEVIGAAMGTDVAMLYADSDVIVVVIIVVVFVIIIVVFVIVFIDITIFRRRGAVLVDDDAFLLLAAAGDQRKGQYDQ